MKLIVDAQLPSKLCEILDELGIDAIHVNQLPKGDEISDYEFSEYADSYNLMVKAKN